ncbi:hypothetical protein D9M68_758040 [compost metagenome]
MRHVTTGSFCSRSATFVGTSGNRNDWDYWTLPLARGDYAARGFRGNAWVSGLGAGVLVVGEPSARDIRHGDDPASRAASVLKPAPANQAFRCRRRSTPADDRRIARSADDQRRGPVDHERGDLEIGTKLPSYPGQRESARGTLVLGLLGDDLRWSAPRLALEASHGDRIVHLGIAEAERRQDSDAAGHHVPVRCIRSLEFFCPECVDEVDFQLQLGFLGLQQLSDTVLRPLDRCH